MKNTFEGQTFYESTFETTRGVLVREVEARPRGRRHNSRYEGLTNWISDGLSWEEQGAFKERWRLKFGDRDSPFSPSPETVDISITDWCDFGCSYCYQDSTAKQKHAPKDLVDKVLHSFDTMPYQIAIGGGEPTSHPDFPEILLNARAAGVVPNYTTAGNILRPEVIEATNKACGGVAMTYHSWKGLQWFADHYVKLRKLLKVQLNVHLIADKDVATNLEALTILQKTVGKLNVVLLAYYPDVGRGTLRNIMPKTVYAGTLPTAIKAAIDSRMTLAFSEGLLPYFLSRPELGVETRFASRAEGLFSAYVDPRGRFSSGSFDPPPKPETPNNTEKFVPEYRGETAKSRREALEHNLARHPTVWESSLQDQWNKMHEWSRAPSGAACMNCKLADSCATPNTHHYFACAFATHNGKPAPLNDDAQRQVTENLLYKEAADLEKQLGRKMTDEEYKPFQKRFKALRDY
jgi:hypothetical protein